MSLRNGTPILDAIDRTRGGAGLLAWSVDLWVDVGVSRAEEPQKQDVESWTPEDVGPEANAARREARATGARASTRLTRPLLSGSCHCG